MNHERGVPFHSYSSRRRPPLFRRFASVTASVTLRPSVEPFAVDATNVLSEILVGIPAIQIRCKLMPDKMGGSFLEPCS